MPKSKKVEKAKTGKEPEKPAKPTEVKKEKKKSKKKHPDIKWYVIGTYSGHEKKVSSAIMQRAEASNLSDLIDEVVVPTQNKIVVKEGKQEIKEEQILPGYVLVNMVLNEKTWHVVRNAEGVTGFVGTDHKPTPLPPDEAKSILKFMEIEQPAYQVSFNVGDAVRITVGAFADFVGTIGEINEDKGQVKVLISIFGRETPVDLDFTQVTKL